MPGGDREANDEGPWATAFRETIEELGLNTEQIVLLAQLEQIDTRTTGYRVSPFLVIARDNTKLCLEAQMAEVEEAVVVAVDVLASDTAVEGEEVYFPGWNDHRKVAVRRAHGRTTWGPTLRILEPVLPQTLAGKWNIT